MLNGGRRRPGGGLKDGGGGGGGGGARDMKRIRDSDRDSGEWGSGGVYSVLLATQLCVQPQRVCLCVPVSCVMCLCVHCPCVILVEIENQMTFHFLLLY